MKFCVLGVLIFAVHSCKSPQCDWKGGEITDYGTYCNDDIEVKVYEEDNYLRYEVRNAKGDLAVRQDVNISVFHHWGIFLDNKKNLWVFSSDVGHALWKRNPLNGEYARKHFPYKITRDSVPDEVYSSAMRRFIDVK